MGLRMMRGVHARHHADDKICSERVVIGARPGSQSPWHGLQRLSGLDRRCVHAQRKATCHIASPARSLAYSWERVEQMTFVYQGFGVELNTTTACQVQQIQQGAAAVRSPYKPDMQDRHVTLMDFAHLALEHLAGSPTACLPGGTSPGPPGLHHVLPEHVDGLPTGFNYSTSVIPGLHPCWDLPSCMIAVFDGHSGSRSATYAAARMGTLLASDTQLWSALIGCAQQSELDAEVVAAVRAGICSAFTTLDKEILDDDRYKPPGEFDGSTALMGLQVGQHLFVANLGDTRAVLSRGGEAVRLSRDHTPQMADERRRIEAAGGAVRLHKGVWRLVLPLGEGLGQKICAVSRAFGDIDYKEPRPLMTATPDVTYCQLLPSTDRFVIYATDGVWSVLDDQQAVQVVQMALDKSRAQGFTPEQCAEHAAVQLVSTAMDFGSYDDITAVVTPLTWAQPDL